MVRALPSKLVSETIKVSFDFMSMFEWEEVVSTASVTVEVFTGLDYEPVLLLDGLATFTDTVVTQSIHLGMPGVIYSLTATAEGDLGSICTQTRLLAVLSDDSAFKPPSFVQLTGVLPDGTARVPYEESLDIYGGFPPYEFDDIISGTAPPWMSFNVLDAALVCSGLPDETTTTSYTFNPQIRDAVNNLASDPQTPTFVHLVISGDVPDGLAGTAVAGMYSQTNGYGTVTYAVTSGAFPSGLTLNTDGTYAGTYVAGVYSWDITGTDSVGNTYTIHDSCTVTQVLWFALSSSGGGNAYVSTDELDTFTTVARSPFITGANLPCALGTDQLIASKYNVGTPSDVEVYSSLNYSQPLLSSIVTITSNNIYRLKYIDDIAFACIYGTARVYESLNGGTTWTLVYDARGDIIDIAKVGGNWVLYDIGAPTYLKYSADRSTWSNSTLVDPNIYSGFACNGSVCVVLSNNTEYYRTTGGVVWTTHTLPENRKTAPQAAIAIGDVFIFKIVNYTGEGTQIWRSVDAGINFTRVQVNATDDVISGFAYGGGLLVAWSTTRVFKSSDVGATWSLVTMPVGGSWGLTYAASFME